MLNGSQSVASQSATGGYLTLALRTETLPPADHTNCYIIGTEQALIVDPGCRDRSQVQRLRDELHRLRGSGGTLAAIFLTHHHPDHVGAVAPMAEEFHLPVAAHPKTLSRLTLSVAQTRSIETGHTFTVDQTRSLEATLTPGHAAGHLCLFEREASILLSGDMVPGMGTTVINPPEGDMAQYLASLEQLAALQPTLILPAHGPPVPNAASAIRELIQHRLLRESKVLVALAEEHTLAAITRAAYKEVDPWVLPLASRSTLAHLLKLQQEERVMRIAEDRWKLIQQERGR